MPAGEITRRVSDYQPSRRNFDEELHEMDAAARRGCRALIFGCEFQVKHQRTGTRQGREERPGGGGGRSDPDATGSARQKRDGT